MRKNSEISICNTKAAKLITSPKSTDYAHAPSYLMEFLCSDDDETYISMLVMRKRESPLTFKK